MATGSPKTIDYSLLVVFGDYLRSKCTIPDIYTCVCEGLVVIQDCARLTERRRKKERRRRKKMNNLRGRRFQFTA